MRCSHLEKPRTPEAAPLPLGTWLATLTGTPCPLPAPAGSVHEEGPQSSPRLHLDALLANGTLLAKPARLRGRGYGENGQGFSLDAPQW